MFQRWSDDGIKKKHIQPAEDFLVESDYATFGEKGAWGIVEKLQIPNFTENAKFQYQLRLNMSKGVKERFNLVVLEKIFSELFWLDKDPKASPAFVTVKDQFSKGKVEELLKPLRVAFAMDTKLNQEKKRELEVALGNFVADCLENGSLTADDFLEISDIIVAKIGKVESHRQMLSLISELKQRWAVFSSLIQIIEGKRLSLQ